MEALPCLFSCGQRPVPIQCVPRKHEAIEAIDWLGLWGVSLGFCAIVLAGIADFVGHDNLGAAFILVGTAGIIALILQKGAEPVDRE